LVRSIPSQSLAHANEVVDTGKKADDLFDFFDFFLFELLDAGEKSARGHLL
jgi:hypothetical protein